MRIEDRRPYRPARKQPELTPKHFDRLCKVFLAGCVALFFILLFATGIAMWGAYGLCSGYKPCRCLFSTEGHVCFDEQSDLLS